MWSAPLRPKEHPAKSDNGTLGGMTVISVKDTLARSALLLIILVLAGWGRFG
jgi:hypothetical protein